ncbi:MAG TPA: IPT/TIG domain-containing protein [Terriglobia bacterium]|nr:IPT/TIG domain-containing protein [Terriglobia bacterium]
MRLFRLVVFLAPVLLATVCAGRAAGSSSAAPKGSAAAEAPPRISNIEPSQTNPGSRITVKITGENFLTGAYVSFTDPAIHVIATRRASGTELDVDIAVGQMAKPQSVVLYVSNPSGASAQTAFAVASGEAPAQQESQPSSSNPPVVTRVNPAQAAPGSKQTVKVTGKNFKQGAKVAFSNPGIRVLSTDFKKSTQLVAQIEVAPNAPAGKTSLFVINPDDSEVETSFEVRGENSGQTGTTAEKTPSQANTPTQQWSVYNLGDATSILQNPGKAKGELVVKSGMLEYDQDGKAVFTAKPGDIQEIAPNVFFGLNTGTFHIILKSGKTYNFVSSSLTPADTNSIVESLHSALK